MKGAQQDSQASLMTGRGGGKEMQQDTKGRVKGPAPLEVRNQALAA